MKKWIILILTIAIIGCGFALYHVMDNSGSTHTIYVSINGDDKNNGTISKPYRTFKKAALEAKAGTVVYIREGIYNEQLIVQHSGTKEKPVVFKAYNQENVVISGEGLKQLEGDIPLVTIEDNDYVTISGLTIQDLTTDVSDHTVMGIFVTGSSSHIHLENNHVHDIKTLADDGNAHGIAVYGTDGMKDIVIVNNTVEDLILGASESIVLNGNIDGFTVKDNLVRRNNNIGIDLIGFEGISNDPNADFVRNGCVKNNTVYEISSFGNPAYGEEYAAGGIYIDGGKNIIVEENKVYANDIGIEATSEHANQYAENISILHNEIYNNHFTGISVGGYDKERGGTKNSVIAENVLYRNDTKALEGGQLLMQHNSKNIRIEKNIFTAGPTRIFIANYFDTIQNNTWKQNVFHDEEGKEGIWIWKNKSYTSFPDFQKASNSDEESRYMEIEDIDFILEKTSLGR